MNLRIRMGKTRIVVIFGSYAYKLVRFRLIDLLLKWLRLEYERIKFGDRIAYRNLRRHSRTQLLKDMLLACFMANYREYQGWKNCPNSEKYVPTLFTFFYLVNIQERDDVMKDYSNKIISLAHNRRCGELLFNEMLHMDNLSASGRILDYGGPIEPHQSNSS